jgi:hypothetical protein
MTLNTAAGYGLNLTGGNLNDEVDLIAQLTTNGGSLSGLYDVNNFGYGLTDASVGGAGVYDNPQTAFWCCRAVRAAAPQAKLTSWPDRR